MNYLFLPHPITRWHWLIGPGMGGLNIVIQQVRPEKKTHDVRMGFLRQLHSVLNSAVAAVQSLISQRRRSCLRKWESMLEVGSAPSTSHEKSPQYSDVGTGSTCISKLLRSHRIALAFVLQYRNPSCSRHLRSAPSKEECSISKRLRSYSGWDSCGQGYRWWCNAHGPCETPSCCNWCSLISPTPPAA